MDNFQPPAIPGVSQGASSAGSASGANPFFTVANQFLPRNLHDVIRWAKYITMQSPVTTEVIRKLSTYPITDFLVDSKSEKVKEKYEEVFKSFKLKQLLYDIGFEYYTVGNVFVSIYFPIQRSLICPGCKTAYNAKKANFVSFKKFGFHGTCPACSKSGEFERKDTKSIHVPDMNLIKWDPTHIIVNHNPITGESEYYYKIPNDIKRRVQQGDKLFVNSVPWGLIEAIRNNQDFKFDDNHIFHLKNVSAGHSINGIAVPPLISLFPLVYYQATLRKANESISTDYMNPLRVVFPQAQTGNSDPVVAMSMRSFVGNMTEALAKHKRDKNHVLIAPMPIGYQAVSGEGKNLLVSQEIQQAEESILLSLGVSRELLSGVTNWQSSTVGLRLLQNTMTTYTDQMVNMINWVMLHVTKYIGIETCDVTLVPFKLTDDDSLRQALLQMVATDQAAPSDLYESFGMDYAKVLDRMKEDKILKATSDVETKFVTEQAMFLASKNVVDRFDKDNDYRTALAKAQNIAQQLYQADPMMRLTVLDSFQVSDYPMYVLVSHLLATFDEQQAGAMGEDPNAEGAQAGAQGQGQGAEGKKEGGDKPSSAKPEAKAKSESKPDNK
jgi:hypothetical protein